MRFDIECLAAILTNDRNTARASQFWMVLEILGLGLIGTGTRAIDMSVGFGGLAFNSPAAPLAGIGGTGFAILLGMCATICLIALPIAELLSISVGEFFTAVQTGCHIPLLGGRGGLGQVYHKPRELSTPGIGDTVIARALMCQALQLRGNWITLL